MDGWMDGWIIGDNFACWRKLIKKPIKNTKFNYSRKRTLCFIDSGQQPGRVWGLFCCETANSACGNWSWYSQHGHKTTDTVFNLESPFGELNRVDWNCHSTNHLLRHTSTQPYLPLPTPPHPLCLFMGLHMVYRRCSVQRIAERAKQQFM